MLKRILYSALVLTFILLATYAIMSFGRGYRLDFAKKSLTPTGILAVSSYPEGASIYVNGKLLAATNNSINIAPNWYDIKISKEGYIPWQKKVSVKGEIVTKVDVLLIPQNPSLRPLTSGGVLTPVLSPTNNQLAYIVPFDASVSALLQKGGIYIWNLKEGPLLPIGNGPRLIARSTSALNLTNANIVWSPDEKEIFAVFFKDHEPMPVNFQSAYILDTNLRDQIPTQTTLNTISFTLADWKDQEIEKNKTILSSLHPLLTKALKDTSTDLEFSQDENKLMYMATSSASLPLVINPPLIGTDSTVEDRQIIPNTVYVYDIKEDKNFKIKTKVVPVTPQPKKALVEAYSPVVDLIQRLLNERKDVQWYPDSKHILMVENSTIDITDYDGINKTTVYAGPLEDSYVFPWPSGGKILILTTYNKTASPYPNLYAVDIR